MKFVHILLVIAAGTSEAQAVRAMTGQECSSMPDDSTRLSCYDQIFKTKETGGKAMSQSKWTVTTEKSKMDDSEIINLSLTAEGYGSEINVRCEEKVTSVYFTLGGTFMADIEGYGVIRYRVDADKQQKKSFVVSTDNEGLGLWSGGTSIPFLKQLIGRDKLTVEITAYNESATTKEFALVGLDKEIEPLRKQCKW